MKKMMTNLKKVYVKPYSDFVLVCNNKHILDAHTTRMSYVDFGNGTKGTISDGGREEGDAKEMHWDDSWNDFSMENNEENYW